MPALDLALANHVGQVEIALNLIDCCALEGDFTHNSNRQAPANVALVKVKVLVGDTSRYYQFADPPTHPHVI